MEGAEKRLHWDIEADETKSNLNKMSQLFVE